LRMQFSWIIKKGRRFVRADISQVREWNLRFFFHLVYVRIIFRRRCWHSSSHPPFTRTGGVCRAAASREGVRVRTPPSRKRSSYVVSFFFPTAESQTHMHLGLQNLENLPLALSFFAAAEKISPSRFLCFPFHFEKERHILHA